MSHGDQASKHWTTAPTRRMIARSTITPSDAMRRSSHAIVTTLRASHRTSHFPSAFRGDRTMVETSAHSSSSLCIGVILFDETHSRVFAVRGTTIEDALEFTAYAEAPGAGSRRSRSGKLVCAPEWLQARARHTAQLVTALHEIWRFDALLIAGSGRSRDLLCLSLTVEVPARSLAPLKVPVSAGESAILAAVLARAPVLVHRRSRSARDSTIADVPVSPGTISRSFVPPLPGARMPHPVFGVPGIPASASHAVPAPA